MKKLVSLTIVVMFFLSYTSTSYAGSGVEKLSPELRGLLKKEMLALQDGMKSIIPAYVSGNLAEVARIAGKMKGSYILKQRLTEDQKHELMSKLPNGFLKLDQKFHEYAGMLEHVSEEKHMELVGFYFSKLGESCVSCHSQYGGHRFPDLHVKLSDESQHH